MTLGDAREGNNSDPKKIIEKLHVNWGHASAQQIKRILVDAEGDRHDEQREEHRLERVEEPGCTGCTGCTGWVHRMG